MSPFPEPHFPSEKPGIEPTDTHYNASGLDIPIVNLQVF